jgi:predicted sulfurtransferase
MNKRILLFYKYVSVDNPQAIALWQKTLCTSLNLTGRVLIAPEGINGTLCGSQDTTDQYILSMNEHPLFGNIDFKDSIVNGDFEYFPRLQVSIKPEIVSFGMDTSKITVADTGTHLTPQQVHELLQESPNDLIVLDVRNHWEAKVGKFTNAIVPTVQHSRDFPTFFDNNLEIFKDKQVLMYCTGGVRCERATAYLKLKGVAKNIYQIQGGIHRYIEKFPNGFFRGKNYVFDARITVKVNDDVLGKCDICAAACDQFTNCRNATCNKHFIGCSNCLQSLGNACSASCQDLLENHQATARPYRPMVDARLKP